MLDRSHLMVVREVERRGPLSAAADPLTPLTHALDATLCSKRAQAAVRYAAVTREGRYMRLTQAGPYLLGLANRLLPHFEFAEERMKQYALGERGTLRIGMEGALCYPWLIGVVSPALALAGRRCRREAALK